MLRILCFDGIRLVGGRELRLLVEVGAKFDMGRTRLDLSDVAAGRL